MQLMKEDLFIYCASSEDSAFAGYMEGFTDYRAVCLLYPPPEEGPHRYCLHINNEVPPFVSLQLALESGAPE